MLTTILALALLGGGGGKTQNAPTQGLKGEYFRGQNFEQKVHTRYDRAIDFRWTYKTVTKGMFGGTNEEWTYISPAPGVPAEDFSVRWTTDLLAPETGTYTFEAKSDDGIRIWVGDLKVLDEWHLQQEADFNTPIYLEKGKYYPIRVEYYNHLLDARVAVNWRLPSQPDNAPTTPIPASAFYTPVLPKAKPLIPKASARDQDEVAEAKPAAVAPARTEPKPEPKPVAKAATERAKPSFAPPFTAQPSSSAPLPKLKKGTSLTLPNLYFELDSPDLMPTSEPTLDALVDAMATEPAARIQIAGHTDLSKDPARSLKLSRNRAEAIREYLIENGVDSSRITTVGYGCTKPLYNTSDARNRRVEVHVK